MKIVHESILIIVDATRKKQPTLLAGRGTLATLVGPHMASHILWSPPQEKAAAAWWRGAALLALLNPSSGTAHPALIQKSQDDIPFLPSTYTGAWTIKDPWLL